MALDIENHLGLLYNKYQITIKVIEIWKSIATDPKIDITYYGRHLCNVTIGMQEFTIPNVWILIANNRIVLNYDAIEY